MVDDIDRRTVSDLVQNRGAQVVEVLPREECAGMFSTTTVSSPRSGPRP